MSTINFSINGAGSITPTATQSAVVNDSVSFTETYGYTVYVYNTSGQRTSALFGTDAIRSNEWPQNVDATGVYTLSTCPNGPMCDEAGLIMKKGAMYSNASVSANKILGTRSNGSITVGTGR